MRPKGPKVKASLPVVHIVGDGAMANADISHGRVVPWLIVETRAVPELPEIINAHATGLPGDILTDWGEAAAWRDSRLLLHLKFVRPISSEFAIVFEMPKHAGLVDQAVTSRAVYLQAGNVGDRVTTTPDAPRLLVEVARHDAFARRWEYLFPRIMAKQLRSEYGVSSSESRRLGAEAVVEWRKFGTFRMPS